MKISKSTNFKPRALIPAKTYNCIFVGYYYIGTQRSEYKGETNENPEIVLAFDIAKVRVEWEGKDCPARMNSFPFTLSIGKKANFRKFLNALLGRDLTPAEEDGFELRDFLGMPIGLVITHYTGKDGQMRDRIGQFVPVDDDKEIPKLETEIFARTCLDEVTGDLILPTKESGWPKWLQDKCYESLEFQAAIQAGKIAAPASSAPPQGTMTVIDDDETPF